MQKRLLAIIISCVFFQILFSQENYQQAYVLNLKKDTLKGFVDYRNWDRNPKTIYFKKSIEEERVAYTPLEIIEVGVQGEIYKGHVVDAEFSPEKPSREKPDPEIHLRKDTIFLQALFIGNKSLFYYKSPEGKDNFYIDQGKGPELLFYKKYLKKEIGSPDATLQQQGSYLLLENNRYKGQLTIYLSDCATIKEKLERVTYTVPSMVRLFKYYYKNVGANAIFQKETEKLKIEKGLVIGFTQKTLRFTGNSIPFLTEADFTSSNDLTAGLFFDVIFPRNQGKWSVYNELMYSSFNIKGVYEEFNREEDYTITTTAFKYSYLNLNTFARYKHPVGRMHFYINVGMSNSYVLSENENRIDEIKFYTSERTEEGSALEGNSQKYEHGYIFGMGAKFGHFSAELRYSNSSGMVNRGFKSHVNTYCFLVGFRF